MSVIEALGLFVTLIAGTIAIVIVMYKGVLPALEKLGDWLDK